MHEQQCKRNSQLVLWYRDYLSDGKSAAFVSRVATRYTPGTLARLCGSADHEIRRASVMALGMVGKHDALSAVGKCLSDEDRCVRLVAEVAFCDLSRRQFGSAVGLRLDAIRRHIDGHRYKKSLGLLNELTEQFPQFADAWHMLSIVRFCLGNYQRAIDAANRAIQENPYHFLAHGTVGRSWLELDEPVRALRAFEKSFAINCSQIGIKGYIDVLLKQTRGAN